MKSMQYTIRSIPPSVDNALRKQVQKTGKSLNEVVVETLSKGLGVSAKHVSYHDLDWFIGQHTLNHAFDDNQAWLDSLPKEIA